MSDKRQYEAVKEIDDLLTEEKQTRERNREAAAELGEMQAADRIQEEVAILEDLIETLRDKYVEDDWSYEQSR